MWDDEIWANGVTSKSVNWNFFIEPKIRPRYLCQCGQLAMPTSVELEKCMFQHSWLPLSELIQRKRHCPFNESIGAENPISFLSISLIYIVPRTWLIRLELICGWKLPHNNPHINNLTKLHPHLGNKSQIFTPSSRRKAWIPDLPVNFS